MANNLVTNPMTVDTAATLWSNTPRRVRLIQWIDDAADIVDDDDLLIVINGATITGKIALTANTVNNLCVWEFGPFNPGILVDTFIVTTLDHGLLVIVVE
jgi:hypothetical protein